MADEVVYRLIAGEGVQLAEDSSTRTVTVSVPSLDQKINVGDIGQASTITAGIVELATDAEVQDGTDTVRAVTPAGLAAATQEEQYATTAGRLLKVGSFGLGSSSPDAVLNIDTIFVTGFYRCTNNASAPTLAAYAITHQQATASSASQKAARISDNREFMRWKNGGAWSAWVEVYNTGNFDPATKANTSGQYLGLDVGNAATVGDQLATELAPPGMRGEFFRQTAPAGWLKANGAAVSRTTYARLFAAIGTFWGAGNGSTTFNLPDARGYFSRAWDDGRGVDTGRAFGSYQASQNLSHTHAAGVDTQGAHQHGLFSNDNSGASGTNEADFHGTGDTGVSQGTTATAGAHDHNVLIGASGGSESRPQSLAVLVCIKY